MMRRGGINGTGGGAADPKVIDGADPNLHRGKYDFINDITEPL